MIFQCPGGSIAGSLSCGGQPSASPQQIPQGAPTSPPLPLPAGSPTAAPQPVTSAPTTSPQTSPPVAPTTSPRTSPPEVPEEGSGMIVVIVVVSVIGFGAIAALGYGYRVLSKQGDKMLNLHMYPFDDAHAALNEDDLGSDRGDGGDEVKKEIAAAVAAAVLAVVHGAASAPQTGARQIVPVAPHDEDDRYATLVEVEPHHDLMPHEHLSFAHHPGDEVYYDRGHGHWLSCSVVRCERTPDGVHYVVSGHHADGTKETHTVSASQLHSHDEHPPYHAPVSPSRTSMRSLRPFPSGMSSFHVNPLEERPAFAPIGGYSASTQSAGAVGMSSTRSQRRHLPSIGCNTPKYAPFHRPSFPPVATSPHREHHRPAFAPIGGAQTGSRSSGHDHPHRPPFAPIGAQSGSRGSGSTRSGGHYALSSVISSLRSGRREADAALMESTRSTDAPRPSAPDDVPTPLRSGKNEKNEAISFSVKAKHNIRHHHHHSPHHQPHHHEMAH
eukprot:Hpha_TRINITY_DN15930_c2_g5::TRINITY_DN15930_c2_g5_i2::g.74718::m.74718